MMVATSLPQLLDSALEAKALVVGSLPQEGRDLDLLVRPAEHAAASAVLATSGFEQFGKQWFRFCNCTVEIVDLIPVEEWALPAGERESLFAQSLPLEGSRRISRPAPHHVVLIVARRLTRGGRLTPKLRGRVASALAENTDAWADAQSCARGWGVSGNLPRLEAEYRRKGRHRRLGLHLGALIRRPRWGAVITLSGLDGAGKSSQAASLQATLERLGFDCVITWIPLGNSWTQNVLARLGRRLLRVSSSEVSASGTRTGAARRPGGRLGIEVWAMVGALTNAVALGLASVRHLSRGRVIIFDRYRLDAIVHMRFSYGGVSRFRLQNSLIRGLTPRPRRSYLLRVAAETAHGRKELQYSLDELRSLARLYDAESQHQAVLPLDGEQPRERVCAQLAQDVWRSLR